MSTIDMDVTKPPPVEPAPGRPDAGVAPALTPRQSAAPIASPPAQTTLAGALAGLADPVHIHPLDLTGALQIMLAEVRAELPVLGTTAPAVLPLPLLPPGAAAPQTLVRQFLDALPPPESLEPAVWLTSVVQVEGALQVALDRAVSLASAWRDVPAAVVEGARETRDLTWAAITDDPPNPLWLRPEWLGLVPRMQEYRRRRRRARRWISDPDLHWHERDEEPGRDARFDARTAWDKDGA